MTRIVVVGAGLAGVRTAEALRRQGSQAAITLIGDETEQPYDRPPLSKDVLLGKVSGDEIRLLEHARLAELDLDLRLGVRATALDPVRREVRLESGETVSYDEVVLATGTRARPLPLGDLEAVPEGVHMLRSLTDALELRDAFAAGNPRVAIIGGGVIGCEVASAARTLGLETAIIDVLPKLMQRVVGDVIADRLAEMHTDAGVALHLGAEVERLEVEAGHVSGVRLVGGDVVPADIVVVGIGAVPNVEWLEGSGLTIDDGVMADQYLRAIGVSNVHVVGDIARWRHPSFDSPIRMEHWTAAIDHAGAVAKTLTGRPTSATEVPYVWTDQYGRRMQIAGRIRPDDEVVFVVDEPGPPAKFLALLGSNGVQHAAVGFGAAPLLVKQKIQMGRGDVPWPPVLD